MIPLGFFQVLVIPVNLILIQLRIGESLAIPLLSEPIQIRGVLAEKRAFVHLSGRERREIECQVGHYLHPNETHCCIKCHKGTYLSEHCSGSDKAPKCSVCPENAFMPTENNSPKCFACQSCRTSFQQIIKFSCTKWENTVCGCDSNQYKTTGDSEFLCKNCSDCHNGKIRQDCTSDSDTICECHRGFFLQEDQNKCLPCSSCNKEDCQEQCETGMETKRPSNSTELVSVLSFLTIMFAIGFVALTFRTCKKYSPERRFFSSCTSGEQLKKQLPSKTADKAKNSLLDIKEETILGTMQVLPLGNGQGQELPDCIKSARETRISDSPVVLYAVMDAVPVLRWKEFVRNLGLSENTIERIFFDHRSVRDAQYETLKEWRLLANHDATMERISQVLSKMDLSGCIEDIQEALAKQ